MTPTALKRIRQNLGLTQQGLAKMVGVDRVTVARWETGTHKVSEPIARLLRFLHREVRGKGKRKR